MDVDEDTDGDGINDDVDVDDDNDDNDDQTEQVVLTIVQIAAQEPDLSILVEALTAADGDLLTTLSGGNFTVLAPTNDAFAEFLSANGFASLEEVPIVFWGIF